MGEVVDKLVLRLRFDLIVEEWEMKMGDNGGVGMFVEMFGEVMVVDGSVEIKGMDVMKMVWCRGYGGGLDKLLVCDKVSYFIVLLWMLNFERKGVMGE